MADPQNIQALEAALEINRKIAESMKTQIEETRLLTEESKQRNLNEQEMQKLLDNRKAIIDALNNSARQGRNNEEMQIKRLLRVNSVLSENQKIMQRQLELLKQATNQDQNKINKLEQELKLSNKIREENKLIIVQIQDKIDKLQKILVITNDIAKAAHGISGMKGGFFTEFFQNLERHKKSFAEFKDHWKEITGKLLGKAMTAPAVESMNITLNLLKEQQTGLQRFGERIGDLKAYGEVFPKLQQNLAGVILDTSQMTDVLGELHAGMADFSKMTVGSREEMARQVAVLNKLGMSTNAQVKSLNFLTKAFGMNKEDASKWNLEIYSMSQNLGVEINQLTNDAITSLPRLAYWGKEMSTKIFKDLAAMSKASGIEMQGLLNVAEKFDTLSGASQAVGQLNAILGGPYLNAIEMINAEEADRISILKESIEMSGKNFDAMNRYEKKALASSIGVSVEELAKIMNMSTDEYEKNKLATQKNAESQANLEKKIVEMAPQMEKFQLLWRQIAVAMLPVLEQGYELAKLIGKLTTEAITFAKENPFATSIIGWASAISALILKIVSLKKALDFAKEIKSVAKFFASFRGLSTGITLGGAPILATVAAIAAAFIGVGAAVYQVIKYWDELESAVNNAGDTFNHFKKWISGDEEVYENEGLSRQQWREKSAKMSPKAADGATDFSGGPILVGERGPEMVVLPPHSNVITNQNTQKLITNNNSPQLNADAIAQKISSAIISALAGTERNVVLQINERKLAEVVVNVLDRKYNMKFSV